MPRKNSNWTSLGHEAGFERRQRGSRNCTVSCLTLWPLQWKSGDRKWGKSGDPAGHWITTWMMGFEVCSWHVPYRSTRGVGYLAKPNSICSVSEKSLALGAIFTWDGSEETLGRGPQRDIWVHLYTCAHTTAHMYLEHTPEVAAPWSLSFRSSPSHKPLLRSCAKP